jgi:hypothetical protein
MRPNFNSEEDAPQQLLPLPDALPVDPDMEDLKVKEIPAFVHQINSDSA